MPLPLRLCLAAALVALAGCRGGGELGGTTVSVTLDGDLPGARLCLSAQEAPGAPCCAEAGAGAASCALGRPEGDGDYGLTLSRLGFEDAAWRLGYFPSGTPGGAEAVFTLRPDSLVGTFRSPDGEAERAGWAVPAPAASAAVADTLSRDAFPEDSSGAGRPATPMLESPDAPPAMQSERRADSAATVRR